MSVSTTSKTKLLAVEPDDRQLATILAERTMKLCRIDSVIGEEKALADHMEEWSRSVFSAEEIYRHSHSLVLGSTRGLRVKYQQMDRVSSTISKSKAKTLTEEGDQSQESVGVKEFSSRDGDSPASSGISERPVVALFGHLDTVPPHPGDAAPRWEPGEDFGKVVGLGSSDMKSGLAVMQLLAENFYGRTADFDLLFIFYEREEGPYLENGLGPLFDELPFLKAIDFAICLEPSDNAVQMGCCGALHAKIQFSGKSAHSARPWQGENAIHKAGPLLAKLLSKQPVEIKKGDLLFREVMSVTLAEGGRARNVIPERFSLNLNYRFAPGKSLEAAKDDVLRLVDGSAEVEFTDLAPSGAVVGEDPIAERLLERTGAKVEAKQAWTDVGRLSSLGIPAVNFGPGNSAQAHQAGEWVSVSNIIQGYRMFERFLGR